MPFQLYGLPAEIYDKIMEYALAAQLERRVLYAKDWNSWEANARKAHDPTMNLAMIPARRPPPLKVNEWLVSERFFLDTARIWFSVQRFDRRTQCSANLESVLPVWSRTAWRSEHQTFSMTPSAVMLSHRIGLFYTYATSVDVPAAMIPQVLRCRSLEYLRIELRPEDFDLDPRYGWKDVLTDSIRRRTRLNALPACKKVEVYCPEGSGVKWQFEPTRHQEMVLRSNVLLLQTLVQKKVAGQSVTRGSQLLKLVEEKLANTTIIRWSTRLDARIPRPLL
ncbi:hypothetical protein B0A48_07185 [Cryoendolithus antarcticus]|uniref:Uncharacterized protein n=1 Tax=Cryoendolithus antarcticus TaxID=1507870 RepID=A0A1V8T8D4_9PEZI|nr:hypothetical protein B0A48_07185 [Cryoendolithus antarcticus]